MQVSEKRHGPPTKASCNQTCHRFAKCTKNPETGEHKCSCSRPCLRIYKPVCGTDGVTYSSECMLMYLVCQDGTDISVKHRGRCFDKGQCWNSYLFTCLLLIGTALLVYLIPASIPKSKENITIDLNCWNPYYSQSSSKRPPQGMRKVVVTRTGRLVGLALESLKQCEVVA